MGGAGGAGASRTRGGLRGGRRNDRWGATSETGAASVTVTRSEAEAFRALVEVTVLFLVTLLSTDKAGVVISGMGWEEDGVGLVEKGFSLVSPFLGFLSV